MFDEMDSSDERDWKYSKYDGMKRMSEMEGETPFKRARPAGDTELRLLIQSKAAGSVIGKGGQNISRLRSENPASIIVPDCPGPERVLTIGGSEDVVLKVLNEVLECLDEVSEAQQKGNHESDARILVHQSQAGCVIGKGGSKIKELREEFGGQIKVYTNCCPHSTDRVIQITGNRDRTLNTITRVLELLRDSPVKGLSTPYNAHNFDEFFAAEYGGWGDPSKSGRFPAGPLSRGPPHMGGGGGGGLMGRGPMGPPNGPPGGFNGPPGPFGRRGPMGPPRGPPPMRGGPLDDFDGGFGKKSFMNGSDLHNNGDMPNTTTQVTIPKDTAGAIIGKGGARIRKIRADSGAAITIEDPRPGSQDRIITINGTEPQIKHAQYLLQQSVREYGGPQGRRY